MGVASQDLSSRQSNRKQRAAIGRIRHGERAAVFGDHSMRQRQADTVALGLSREEGNEDPLQVGFRNAMACVADGNSRPRLAVLSLS